MNQGHIREIDASPWVASMSATPGDHVLPLANDSSGHPNRLPYADFLPELGPDLKDDIVTVDESSHTVRDRVNSWAKATLRDPTLALLYSGSPRSFILESARKQVW